MLLPGTRGGDGDHVSSAVAYALLPTCLYISLRATTLRACYAMAGTDVAYGAYQDGPGCKADGGMSWTPEAATLNPIMLNRLYPPRNTNLTLSLQTLAEPRPTPETQP
eukprot:2619531-Rhodomonas_salina.4